MLSRFRAKRPGQGQESGGIERGGRGGERIVSGETVVVREKKREGRRYGGKEGEKVQEDENGRGIG